MKAPWAARKVPAPYAERSPSSTRRRERVVDAPGGLGGATKELRARGAFRLTPARGTRRLGRSRLPGEAFELRDEIGRERPLGEAPADLLEDALPLGLLVGREIDDGHLALHAVEGGVVLVANALRERVRGDGAGLDHDLLQVVGEGVDAL